MLAFSVPSTAFIILKKKKNFCKLEFCEAILFSEKDFYFAHDIFISHKICIHQCKTFGGSGGSSIKERLGCD
jgi:hypothetical protein